MPLNPLLQKNRPLIHPIVPGQPAVVGTALPAAANSPRAVPDLKIPASVDISAALGGIGLGLVNAITGLHVVVNPYVNMNPNDEIKVFFDNVQVHIHTVAIPNIAVDLHIPYGAFMPGTDKTVSIHYTVTRIAGTVDTSVPRLYRIKLTRPGGVDPSPDPQHQNLVAPVLPAHIIADGVSEADAQAGFKVTIPPYPYMAEYDVIDLRWNGFALPPRTVHPSEVGASIDIDITAAVIALGGDGRDLMVFYLVYDQVNNISKDSVGQPWSVITLVFVHANPNALPAPEVPDAPNGVLRLDHLGTNDVYVYVYPYPPVFVRGDRVTVRWNGQTSTGQPEAFEQTLPVENVPGLLLFTVPNAKAAAIGGGHVDVSYVLEDAIDAPSPKPPQWSKYLRIDVIGQAVGEPWPAPLVRDGTGASVNTLNPIKPGTSNEENTATLTVTDARLKVDNVLAGLWTVAGAQTLYVPWVTVSTDGQVEAPVPREFIAAAVGKQVVVEYVVFRDSGGEAIGTSLPMTLTVSAIAQVALPVPRIPEANSNDELDIPGLVGDAHVTVGRWPFIAAGQRAWLTLTGPGLNLRLLEGHQVTAAEAQNGLSLTVAKAQLAGLADNARITLTFKVAFDGATSEGAAVTFPVKQYTVKNQIDQPWPAPKVVDAIGSAVTTLNPIKPGTANEENTATVEVTDTRLRSTDVLTVGWTVPGRQEQAVPAVVSNGQARAVIPRELLAASIGKTVGIAYVVQRGGGEIGRWERLSLPVLAIAQSALPRPSITEAGGTDELDVSSLSADATATVAAWPFIDTSQRYWLEARGTLANGSSTVIELANNAQVPGLNGVSRPIPLARLQTLKDSSTLTLEMKVTLAGDASDRLTFPTHDYRVKTVVRVAPVISDVSDTIGIIQNGGATAARQVTLSGSATALETINILDNGQVVATANVTQTGQWSQQVTGLAVGAHRFNVVEPNGGGPGSNLWVIEVVRQFEVDANPMRLSGFSMSHTGWVSSGIDSVGKTENRAASGGVPPYTYVSSNVAVASVTGQGKVTGKTNGNAVITVSDTRGGRVSFNVSVSNTWSLMQTPTPATGQQSVNWMPQYAALYGAISTYNMTFRDDANRAWSVRLTAREWCGASGGISGQVVYMGAGNAVEFGSFVPGSELYYLTVLVPTERVGAYAASGDAPPLVLINRD